LAGRFSGALGGAEAERETGSPLVKDEEEKSQGQRDETAAAGVNYGDGLRSKITLGLDEARLTRPVISTVGLQLRAVWALAIFLKVFLTKRKVQIFSFSQHKVELD
jgi:hypothetical protein